MTSNPKNKIIKSDRRPTDYEYALISQHVYGTGANNPPEVGSEFQTEYRTWKIVLVRNSTCGYFGAVYRCDKTKQFVLAHRGTDGVSDFLENFHGIVLNKFSLQKCEAFHLVDSLIHLISSDWPEYRVSFTGHSLGAFLAELSVFYITTCTSFKETKETNAVTFDSPGSRQSIQMLQEEHNSCTKERSEHISFEDIKKLDIITYVCYPNLVNVCNEHIGTVYTINVDLPGGMIASLPILRLVIGHAIDGIVNWFKMSMDENNKDQSLVRRYMADWPKGYHQLKLFFKYAMYQDGKLHVDPDLFQNKIPPLPKAPCRKKSHEAEDVLDKNAREKAMDCWFKLQKKRIKLQFYSNYKVVESLSSFTKLPIHHFNHDLQEFLKSFLDKLQLIRDNNDKESVHRTLQDMWKGLDMPEMLVNSLLCYEINKNTEIEVVSCSGNVDLYEFRKTLSWWLEKTGFTPEGLLNEAVMKVNTAFRIRKRYDMPPPRLPMYPINP